MLQQTYGNIELIVVDDASSDSTESYLRSVASADPRLHYVSNPAPRGAPASRNIAIRGAKGEFLTGLDDDDAFDRERIGAFVDYWRLLQSRNKSPACLYSQDILVNDSGAHLWVSQKKSAVTANELFRGNYIGNQIFAPRSRFIEAGLFDEELPAWQDLELFIRVLGRFGEARLLDMPTYYHSATLRADRISAQEKNIRLAFEIVARKHAGGDARRERALFLQMFNDYYNIKPTLHDWLRLLKWGGRPKGLFRLLRFTVGIRQAAYLPAKAAAVSTPLENRLQSKHGNI
ncbi:MAG: glycosyltransferase [Alphaproteobacteria bacterium]|nr:glycosyltransferase [Alphaproteobacteria bacterium]